MDEEGKVIFLSNPHYHAPFFITRLRGDQKNIRAREKMAAFPLRGMRPFGFFLLLSSVPPGCSLSSGMKALSPPPPPDSSPPHTIFRFLLLRPPCIFSDTSTPAHTIPSLPPPLSFSCAKYPPPPALSTHSHQAGKEEGPRKGRGAKGPIDTKSSTLPT